MKRSKFDKIIEDLIKSTQNILDNANELIQDKKIAEVDCNALSNIIRSSMDLMVDIKNVRSYAEKNDNEVEEVYDFDKCKFTFDKEGDD